MSPARRRGAGARLAGVLAAYVAAVLAAAGAAAWPVHALLAAAGAEVPVHRVTFRLAELLAVLALIPLLRQFGGGGREAWGYGAGRGRTWLAELLAGLGCGVASLGLFAIVLLAAEIRVPQPDLVLDPGWLAGVVAGGVVTALLVSLIEETWLRGALHTLLERLGGPSAALGVTAVLYAAVHFVRPQPLPPGSAPDPTTGFAVLAGSFHRFAEPSIVGPLLALAVAGLLLGQLRHHSGRIAACIGLHAGWVIVIRVLKKTTHMSVEPARLRLVDGYDGVIGWLALAWFAALSVVLWRFARRAPTCTAVAVDRDRGR